jgi:hypothetical protein
MLTRAAFFEGAYFLALRWKSTVNSSTTSPQRNAPTFSPTQDMTRIKPNPL